MSFTHTDKIPTATFSQSSLTWKFSSCRSYSNSSHRCAYEWISRRTTESSLFPMMFEHSDLSTRNKSGASSIHLVVSWSCVARSACAIRQFGRNIQCFGCGRSANIANKPESSFTTSPRESTQDFCEHFSNSEFVMLHKSRSVAKWTVFFPSVLAQNHPFYVPR